MKKTIKKIPAQPTSNPQHKQKCETFVSTRLDNNWISGDRTTHGTTAYKQKYETVAFFKACAKACASQPRVQPYGFWITSPDHNWKKSWFVKLLSRLLRLLAVFILLLGRSFSYFCLCGLKAGRSSQRSTGGRGGRSSQKWSRSSVQPMVQARYNPKHNPL